MAELVASVNGVGMIIINYWRNRPARRGRAALLAYLNSSGRQQHGLE